MCLPFHETPVPRLPSSGSGSFYDQLAMRTSDDRDRLHAAPVIAAALSGRVRRHDDVAFLARAHHHVKHTSPPLMRACGSRVDDHHDRLRSAMARYVQDEPRHQERILADITEAGGDAEAVRHADPDRDTEALVADTDDTVTRRNPVGLVCAPGGTRVDLVSVAADRDAVLRGTRSFHHLYGDVPRGIPLEPLQ